MHTDGGKEKMLKRQHVRKGTSCKQHMFHRKYLVQGTCSTGNIVCRTYFCLYAQEGGVEEGERGGGMAWGEEGMGQTCRLIAWMKAGRSSSRSLLHSLPLSVSVAKSLRHLAETCASCHVCMCHAPTCT